MAAPSVAHASSDYAFGSYEGVLVVSWRCEVKLPHVVEVVRFRNELATRGLNGAIHMFESSVGLPSAEVRKEASTAVAARTNTKPAIGLVFFGTGFAASALRAASTPIFVFRFGPPTRMFANTVEASQWIVGKSAPHVSSLGLRAACDLVRHAGLSGARSGVYSAPSAENLNSGSRE